jgi:hypothetical protein
MLNITFIQPKSQEEEEDIDLFGEEKKKMAKNRTDLRESKNSQIESPPP